MNRFMALAFVVLFLSSCGSHYYHDEAVSYVPAIKEILVESNKCNASGNCPLVFVSGGAWVLAGEPFGGVNISVYEVSEANVISKILASCISNHQNHPNVKTNIKVYSSAHLANEEILVANLKL